MADAAPSGKSPTPWYKKRSFWDGALSYSTVKIIKIADWRLGLLHYLFMFAIIIYVFIFQVYYKRGYLQFEVPTGVVRATLDIPDAYPAGAPALNSLSYCSQNSPSFNGYSNLPCGYVDATVASFPYGQTSPLFITTRFKTQTRDISGLNCTDGLIETNPFCIFNVSDVSNTTRTYVADIEDYTLAIDHVVYANQIDFLSTSVQMKAVWEYRNGSAWQSIGIDSPRQFDGITVGQLLMLAGVNSLDVASNVYQSNHTLRYDGVQIVVLITYTNTDSNPKNFKYHYAVRAIGGLDSARFDPATADTATNRHGIAINFVQTGRVGLFSFPALLSAIVSGLVLTSVATTIVDILAIYILPQKTFYSKHKFSEAKWGKNRDESAPQDITISVADSESKV